MEKKTNLSEEFGSSSGVAGREFGTNYAGLDIRTDLSSEINRSTVSDSAEFGAACADKEFSSLSDAPAPPEKPPRREKHNRSLFMQIAAMGLGAVLVTNSLGMDILGNSPEPEPTPTPVINYIIAYEMVEETNHDDFPGKVYVSAPHVIHSSYSSNEDPGPYGDSIRYDEASNTLYLDGCRADELYIADIEEDLTIFVESTSYIGTITNFGVDITISGNQDAALFINMDLMYTGSVVNWWYGILMYGEGRDVSLTISPDILVSVWGECAIAVDNTVAYPGIRFDASRTMVAESLQSGDFDFGDGASEFVDGGAPDWAFFDDNGQMAKRVVFAPIGTEIP